MPALWAEGDVLCGDGIGGVLDGGVFEEPLHGEAWLDGDAAALGEADVVFVVVDFDDEVEVPEHLDGFFACGEAVEAVEFGDFWAVDFAIGGEDVDGGKVVALADFVVGFVVGGGDFEDAGAELHVDVVIGDEGDLLFGKRADGVFADEVTVAWVVGVDGDAGVAHEGFRTGGGDFDEAAGFAGDGVAHGVELGLLWRGDDFLVGDGGEGFRAPVDHAAAAVDEAFVEEVDEDVADFARVVFVHGEALAFPVAGAAEGLQLLDDDAAVFVFPVPDLLEEVLAAEFDAGFAFFAEFAFDDGLGGDAGVVGAGEPEGGFALLAGAADEDVLDGVVEDVAEVEDAGDVGWGDDDGVGFFVRIFVATEASGGGPEVEPFLFDVCWLVGFGEFWHGAGNMAVSSRVARGEGVGERRRG